MRETWSKEEAAEPRSVAAHKAEAERQERAVLAATAGTRAEASAAAAAETPAALATPEVQEAVGLAEAAA